VSKNSGNTEMQVKINAVLNATMVSKLESIALDIKYYVNINYGIAQALDEESHAAFKFMNDDETQELTEIRHRLKRLAYTLRNKLNQN